MLSMLLLLSPRWMADVEMSEKVVLLFLAGTTGIMAIVAIRAIYMRGYAASSATVIV